MTFLFVLARIEEQRKFTTDRYVVYKWSGRKCSPSPQGGGLLRNEDMQMKKTGFYIIKDKFFEDMPDPYLKGNKAGNRPHYYCLEDTSIGIYWMIPLSSRIDKYKRIMEKKEKAGKPCDILHIVKLDDSRESTFLIQDMFPITEEYIEREYTIARNHLMLTSEHTAKEIERKARKVMGMLKRGIKFTPTQPDVMAILENLRKDR